MEYYKLVAVTGLPGLYELVNSKKEGAIVRSLSDNTTRFASSRIHQFSHLESIEIYTNGDNVNLVDIFNAMDKDASALPDVKDDKSVRAYFEKVYPDMDFDRVYNSDMKKMVKWFDILKKNNIELKLSEVPAEDEETEEASSTDEKPATEKAAEPQPAGGEETEEKAAPAKKAAPKKKAEAKESEEGENASPKKAPAKKKAAPKKKAE